MAGDYRLRRRGVEAIDLGGEVGTRRRDFIEKLVAGAEASSQLAKPSRIGVVATAGDRRDEDMRELGAVAANHFDVIVLREDVSLRGRERGATAALIAEGIRSTMATGARCKQVEVVLDEIAAVRHALTRANIGDLVVLCVDKAGPVLAELESLSHQAQAGAHPGTVVGDPDIDVERRPTAAPAFSARSAAAKG